MKSDALDAAFRESMYRYFKRSRLQSLAGQSGGSFVVVLLTWGIANQTILLFYLITHQMLVALTAFTYYSKYTNDRVTPAGLPAYVLSVGVTTKLFCGSIFWLDLQAVYDIQFVLSVFIVFTGSVVGTIVTLGPLKHIGRQTLVCLIMPGAIACFVAGHPGVAIAALYFLYVVAYKGLTEMCHAFRELIFLRIESASTARELEKKNAALQETNENLKLEVRRREKTEQERTELQEELVTASRVAGKAEIATGVLHNVGNVMNSVNVSTSVVHEKFAKSFQKQLKAAVEILESNVNDLAGFFDGDPRAKHFVPFLGELVTKADRLDTEMTGIKEKIDHVIAVVHAQQSFATNAGVIERVSPASIVESSLEISKESFRNHSIDIECRFEPVDDVNIDKQKMIQIFVNLLRNAAHAISDAKPKIRKIVVTLFRLGAEIVIEIKDSGIGIKPENLPRVFQHGFSTRKSRGGHGFGLHHSICAIKELGGSIEVDSEGEMKGATFTVKFPAESGKRRAVNQAEPVDVKRLVKASPR